MDTPQTLQLSTSLAAAANGLLTAGAFAYDGGDVRARANAWASSLAPDVLHDARRAVESVGFTVLPSTPAGVALADAIAVAAAVHVNARGVADLLETSVDGTRVQGRTHAWESALPGVPEAFARVVAHVAPVRNTGATAAPLRGTLVQPFLLLPGAQGQPWHRDHSSPGFSVLFYVDDVDAVSSTRLVLRSHDANAMLQNAALTAASAPHSSFASSPGSRGAALVFCFGVLHRGSPLAASAPRLIHRIFGYVVGGSPEIARRADASDLARCGIALDAGTITFPDEVLEFPGSFESE